MAKTETKEEVLKRVLEKRQHAMKVEQHFLTSHQMQPFRDMLFSYHADTSVEEVLERESRRLGTPVIFG